MWIFLSFLSRLKIGLIEKMGKNTLKLHKTAYPALGNGSIPNVSKSRCYHLSNTVYRINFVLQKKDKIRKLTGARDRGNCFVFLDCVIKREKTCFQFFQINLLKRMLRMSFFIKKMWQGLRNLWGCVCVYICMCVCVCVFYSCVNVCLRVYTRQKPQFLSGSIRSSKMGYVSLI